jgi:hypothetical protein
MFHRILSSALLLVALAFALASAAFAFDGRSPDTKDAADAASVIRDGRSPDTRDAADAASVIRDGRSPDTRDAALAAHLGVAPAVMVVRGSFDWTDAGIGAAAGFGLALVAGAAIALANPRRSRGLTLPS